MSLTVLPRMMYAAPQRKPNRTGAARMAKSPDMVQQLLDLPDSEFKKVVDQDFRELTPPEIAKALRTPQVAPRWIAALETSLVSLQGQLHAKESDFRVQQLELRNNPKALDEAEATYERWKASAWRVETGLQRALIQARGVIGQISPPDNEQVKRLEAERNEAIYRVMELERAIRAHKDGFPLDEEEPSTQDLTLWKLIE